MSSYKQRGAIFVFKKAQHAITISTVNSLIKAQGAEVRKWQNKGNFQLPVAFYKMKIGPYFAEKK